MISAQLYFSRKNAIFLGLCLGGLALIVGAGILPLSAQHRKLDQKISSIKKKLAEQQQFQTNIIILDGILAKLNQQPTPQVVKSIPLAQDQTTQLTDDFRTLAGEVSLTVDRIDPLLENKTEWNSLTVRAECYGELNAMRLFLLNLLALPYVRQIDRLEIHPSSQALRFRLTYTIDLA